jgi:hypothetical protein
MLTGGGLRELEAEDWSAQPHRVVHGSHELMLAAWSIKAPAAARAPAEPACLGISGNGPGAGPGHPPNNVGPALHAEPAKSEGQVVRPGGYPPGSLAVFINLGLVVGPCTRGMGSPLEGTPPCTETSRLLTSVA